MFYKRVPKRYIVTIVNRHTYFIHCDYRYMFFLLLKCLMSMTFDKLMPIKIPEGYNQVITIWGHSD